MTTKKLFTCILLLSILTGCTSTKYLPTQISRQAPKMPLLPLHSINKNTTHQEVAKKYYTTYLIQKEYIQQLVNLLNV